MRRGFTLVELSIVLVIIGLLIGGILAGQSLIDTSRIQSQIRQIEQLDIANRNFLNKFQRWPGDRDNDGVIEINNAWTCYNPSSAWVTNDECWQVFHELSTMAGLLGDYVGDISATHTTQTMFGKGRYGPVAANNKSGIMAGLTDNKRYMYWIINSSKNCVDGPGGWSFAGECMNSAFKPSEALAIDTKIDDKNAYSGNVAIASSTLNGNGYITHYLPSYCHYSVYPGGCGVSYNEGIITNAEDYAVSFEQSHSNCIDTGSGVYNINSDIDACGIQIRSLASR